jgi:uncharacterized protein
MVLAYSLWRGKPKMDTQKILNDVEHRLNPVTKGPWIMTQAWNELLFAHWPLQPDLLRAIVPPALTLDTFEGEAWIGIVPFHMSQVHPRSVPSVPWLSQFPELNVRTYVSVQGFPGVYFFSLDAANPVAVALARTLFRLPYFNATMRSQRLIDTIDYRSQRTHRGASTAEFRALYRPIAPVFYAQPASLEHWFTERYYLYTVDGCGVVYRGDIHHGRWALQPAELEVISNTMASAHGIQLPDTAPLLHYAQLQEVLIWPLRRVGAPG